MSRDLDAFCAGIQDDIAEMQMQPRNPYDREGKSVSGEGWETRLRPMITTRGYLRGAARAFVYVSAPKHGRVKVGMSGNPEQRCRSLGAKLFYAHEVQLTAARRAETEVLRALGHYSGDGEWVTADPETVTGVVKHIVAKFKWEKAA